MLTITIDAKHLWNNNITYILWENFISNYESFRKVIGNEKADEIEDDKGNGMHRDRIEGTCVEWMHILHEDRQHVKTITVLGFVSVNVGLFFNYCLLNLNPQCTPSCP